MDTLALKDALQGADAAVLTVRGRMRDLQMCVADASIQASVRRFIPADFGSCDSSSPQAQQLVPLFQGQDGGAEAPDPPHPAP